MEKLTPDICKLILNDLSIVDLLQFLKCNKTIKNTYLSYYITDIQNAKPKYLVFKDDTVELKVKLYSAIEYEDLFYCEEIDDFKDSSIYRGIMELNTSKPKYKELWATQIPFVVRSFNGTGFFYNSFTYSFYEYKELLYSENVNNFITSECGIYGLIGEKVDMYIFNVSIDTNKIDSCQIVLAVKDF